MTSSDRYHWDPNAARTAGGLYLAIAVFGAFGIGYVPSQIVALSGAETSANIMANQGLFKLGVLADSAVIVFELAITAILYKLFRNVDPKLAVIAVLSRAGMVSIMGINLILGVMPYVILVGDWASDPAQRHLLVQFCLEARGMGVFVWQLFFGTHLVVLGWLVLKSGLVPLALGRGLGLGGLGYFIQGVAKLTFLNSVAVSYGYVVLLVIATLSEVGFGIWLFIRGGRIQDSYGSGGAQRV